MKKLYLISYILILTLLNSLILSVFVYADFLPDGSTCTSGAYCSGGYCSPFGKCCTRPTIPEFCNDYETKFCNSNFYAGSTICSAPSGIGSITCPLGTSCRISSNYGICACIEYPPMCVSYIDATSSAPGCQSPSCPETPQPIGTYCCQDSNCQNGVCVNNLCTEQKKEQIPVTQHTSETKKDYIPYLIISLSIVFGLIILAFILKKKN